MILAACSASSWRSRQVHEPCLILDGDIIYEPRALRAGLENQADNVMVLSSPTGSGDEYYAWTDEQFAAGVPIKDRWAPWPMPPWGNRSAF